jgi:alkylated DNA repair protein alkB family protein 6
MLNLEAHRVGTLDSLFLVPDYVSEDQEARLLLEVAATKAGWRAVNGRTLLSLGGAVSARGGLIPAPMPSWLAPLVRRLSGEVAVFGGQPNHVLLNVYAAGQGILPHEDGPVYAPGVCILSLGSPAVIRFTRKPAAEGAPRPAAAAVVLPRRSLLVFKDEAYAGCLHGIDAVEEEDLDESVFNLEQAEGAGVGGTLRRTGTRTSLTVRRVLRVHKTIALPGCNR